MFTEDQRTPGHDTRIAAVEGALARVSAKYVCGEVVAMPPNWRQREPTLFTFVLFEDELSRGELHAFFETALALGLPNPRPITRSLLEFAAVFHPLFFHGFLRAMERRPGSGRGGEFLGSLRAARMRLATESALPVASPRYHLQSLLFLAGCTLSAAVIQDRFSEGTIESKLNRLWQAAAYAKRFRDEPLDELRLSEFVIACDADRARSPKERLVAIKGAYSRALERLGRGVAYEIRTVREEPLSCEERWRFGFRDQLVERLEGNLRCILVYGSAVTSRDYSDYDVVAVVHSAAEALVRLSGANPSYNRKDVNIGIYERQDLITFQALSGDNLDHNARCIYGEAEIPVKPFNDLMVRNFSFAFVRLRQLLGMAGYLAKHGLHRGLKNQTHLYHYFVKIPMHVMKGACSVAREPIAKEYINAWTASELGYDLDEQLALLNAERVSEAICNAYLGTMRVLQHLNQRYHVVTLLPYRTGEQAQRLS